MDRLSIIIFVVGMVVTFVGLILLAIIISLLGKVLNLSFGTRKKTSDNPRTNDTAVSSEEAGNIVNAAISSEDESELVAVLTAAVMAYMKQTPGFKIRVKSFRRIHNDSPAWNSVSSMSLVK